MPQDSLLKGKRLLIVDDEPDVLEVLEEMLDMCEVSKATTFEDAGELLKKNDFDMAILDIMGVDGYKLLNIAKQKNITVVMLTAHALNPDNLVKSIKEGANSYIPKEEMSNLTTFLIDILKSQEDGRSSWSPWRQRLSSSFFEKKWGRNWKEQDKQFWEDFDSRDKENKP